MAKKQLLKRLGMQEEFDTWVKNKKTKSFRIGQRVRVKPGKADSIYNYTTSGSIGIITEVRDHIVYVDWEKLTGGRPLGERHNFDVKKEFLELI